EFANDQTLANYQDTAGEYSVNNHLQDDTVLNKQNVKSLIDNLFIHNEVGEPFLTMLSHIPFDEWQLSIAKRYTAMAHQKPLSDPLKVLGIFRFTRWIFRDDKENEVTYQLDRYEPLFPKYLPPLYEISVKFDHVSAGFVGPVRLIDWLKDRVRAVGLGVDD